MIEQGHPPDASPDVGELATRELTALRRVALLLAQDAPPPKLFAAIAQEVSRLVPVDIVHMYRYEPDGTGVAIAEWNSLGKAILEPRARRSPGGYNVRTLVLETERSARIDDAENISGAPAVPARELGVTCSVGTPIVVDGELWGVIVSATAGSEPMPPDAEERIGRFTELMAAGISGAEARREHRLLSDSQASLRQVATLVAESAPAEEIFAAVAEEVGRLLPAAITHLVRYEPDASVIVGGWSEDGAQIPLGTRLRIADESVTDRVRRTGRPARIDDYSEIQGGVADFARSLNVHTTVGSPVVVGGRLWGMIAASSTGENRLTREAEARLADFAELVGIAISNAEAWAELAASRARVVAASDETRRRIERNLHDGAQQRLVALALDLRGAAAALPEDEREVRAMLDQAVAGINSVVEEVREISRGLHPAILSEGGLRPALKSLARRSAVPVELELETVERFPAPLEVATYYLVSESLTNAARHAQATLVRVTVEADDSSLRVTVRDDGVGGADPAGGSGLLGLRDRVESLGGRLAVESPPGNGTSLVAEMPLDGASALPAGR